MTNLYTSNFKLPSRICIVGPGPNGKAFYDAIPKDAFVIAINKAVMIPDISIDVWLINHAHQDWYPEADANYDGKRVYNLRAALEASPNLSGAKNWFYFDTPQDIQINKFDQINNQIHHGGTVASAALQLAFLFGSREVLLCGIDMSGYGYWDGTLNTEPEMQEAHGESWHALTVLNPLIRFLEEEKEMRIMSLSPTRLDVARYEIKTST
jgi:hypothetical protein